MIINTFTTFESTIKHNTILPIALYMYIVTLSHTQIIWSQIPARLIIISTIVSIISRLSSPTKAKIIIGRPILLAATLLFIFNINIRGIIPYAPSFSTHIIMDISICLPLWIVIFIWSTKYITPSTSHYLPENTINSIAPFLALIESIRSLIRPLTLSFRLSANIRAGHVIIAIAGITGSVLISTAAISAIFTTIIGAGYFIFELAICSAQAFVLILLSIIYTNDYFTLAPNSYKT